MCNSANTQLCREKYVAAGNQSPGKRGVVKCVVVREVVCSCETVCSIQTTIEKERVCSVVVAFQRGGNGGTCSHNTIPKECVQCAGGVHPTGRCAGDRMRWRWRFRERQKVQREAIPPVRERDVV